MAPGLRGGLIWRPQGETAEEVAGLAKAMRALAVPVPVTGADVLDIVGTGGDGIGSVNISTGATGGTSSHLPPCTGPAPESSTRWQPSGALRVMLAHACLQAA